MKKTLVWFLILAMALTLFPATAGAAGTPDDGARDLALLEEEMRQALYAANDRRYSEDAPQEERYDPDEVIRVIVELEAAPAVEAASLGSLQSAQATALRGQESTIQAVKRQLKLEPVHRTGYLMNTVSYDIRRGDVAALESMPGVASVTQAVKYQVEMFSAKEMAGVYEAWQLGQTGYTGKGMCIAIIDTGVNWLHQDMVQNPDTVKYTREQMESKIAELGYGKWFSDKVPFGYSYIGGHTEIISSVEPHGHHVAGIAAANGDESEGRISGVAPDAQILALQVFDPVTGGGGYSDDIVSAIEDAVKLGADVVNLSLGTDYGFYGSDRYVSRAVDGAKEAGVFVAVAAGNAEISTDADPSNRVIANDWNLTDTASVADPATAVGATSVASIQGEGFVTYRFSVTANGETRQLNCARISSPAFDFPDGVGFVDGGSGSESEVYYGMENGAGNVVLIKYDPEIAGEDTISGFYYRSYNTGCAGLIIYNADGDVLQEAAFKTSSYYKIPVAFVSAEDGVYLMGLCSSGKKAVMTAYDNAYYFATEDREDIASCFSSWGPTPTLEIKPELAAPGGHIMSVADNTDSYMWMSGTSMAAPFVSGSAALVKQYIQESGMEIKDIPEFIRQTLMNTAKPVLDSESDGMASVRQVGAGIIHLEKAVQNKVLATYNSKAAIELRDNIGKETKGEILLTNYGKEPVTYKLSATDVYTDVTDEETNLYHISVLPGARIAFDGDSVTVPANGTATFSFTLIIDDALDGHFAEGYICLDADSAPGLSLPFLGFMGDWDDETIIDAPSWEKDTVVPKVEDRYFGIMQYGTGLMTMTNNVAAMLGEVYAEAIHPTFGWTVGLGHIDPDRIAISPNGDGYFDVAIPWLGLLRNAEEIRMDILDEDGMVIASPGSAYELRKITAKNFYQKCTGGRQMANSGHAIGWDGTIYDQSTGTYQIAPEGNYTVRLQARVREGGDWQTVTMPLAVDLTPPELTDFTIARSGVVMTFSFKATDEIGIFDEFELAVNNKVFGGTLSRATYDEESGLYTMKVYAYGAGITEGEPVYTALMISDSAGNTSVAYATIDPLEDQPEYGFTNMSLDKTTYVYAKANTTYFRALGFAPKGSKVTFNGQEAVFNGENFSIVLPLAYGDNVFDVVIQDTEENILYSGQATICATNFVSMFSAPIPGDGFSGTNVISGWTLALDEDYADGTEVPIRMRIADPENMTVTCNGKQIKPNEEGYIDFNVTLSGGEAVYSIIVTNPAGYYHFVEGTVWNRSVALASGADLTPVYTPQLWYTDGFAGVTSDMLREDGTFRLRGHLFNPVDKLTVHGQEATVNVDDLTWYCDVALEPGINAVPILAEKDGKSYPCISQKILYETGGPELNLNLPEEYHGKYYVSSPDYLLEGTVSTYLDDAQVYVNDTHVFGSTNFAHGFGESKIARVFSQNLNLMPGDNYFTIRAYNYFGLSTEVTIDLFYGEKPTCTHEKTIVKNAREATCTEEGYTGDEVCADCGETVQAGSVIPAMGHKAELRNAKAATCTEDGYTGDEVCTICGEIVKQGEIIPAHCPSKAFVDLNTGCWYHEYTDYVIAKGLMNGMDKTHFAPEGNLTRGMLVTTLYRLAGEPEVTEPATFTDVAQGRYYTDAVAWAEDLGIAKGMTATAFQPEGTVTRQQAATFLYRYVTEYLEQEAVEGADLKAFTDGDKVQDYAKTAMAWAVAEGFFEGYGDGALRPRASLTRAQMAKLLTILDQDF